MDWGLSNPDEQLHIGFVFNHLEIKAIAAQEKAVEEKMRLFESGASGQRKLGNMKPQGPGVWAQVVDVLP